jgi:rhodanese-related sulfurtransferase
MSAAEREGDGHIEGASWWPLDNFKVAPPEIDRDVPTAVHCKARYRSMIACSLLRRAVFQNVAHPPGRLLRWPKHQTHGWAILSMEYSACPTG